MIQQQILIIAFYDMTIFLPILNFPACIWCVGKETGIVIRRIFGINLGSDIDIFHPASQSCILMAAWIDLDIPLNESSRIFVKKIRDDFCFFSTLKRGV